MRVFVRYLLGQVQLGLGVAWWLLGQGRLLLAAGGVLAVLLTAVSINHVTYQTRLYYQTQQAQFAQLQVLRNERSQLGLEVGALASHARLEAWARQAGFEQALADEVVVP